LVAYRISVYWTMITSLFLGWLLLITSVTQGGIEEAM
jgi:hypothetical protein